MLRRYGIVCSNAAPHLATGTDTFTTEEVNRSSRLTAVLLRMLNSPLRGQVFRACAQSTMSFQDLAEDVIGEIAHAATLENSRLARAVPVDDRYWNDEVYREIPSKWLADRLRRYDD